MSVLIRGMEMPDSCGTCPMRKSNYDRIWCHVLGKYIVFEHEFDGRRPDCPLRPLPDEHGDLKDTTAFEAEIRERYCKNCERRFGTKNGKYKELYEIGGVPCRACWIADMLDELDAFDAVVPGRKRGDMIAIKTGLNEMPDKIKVGDEVYAETSVGKTEPFVVFKVYDINATKYYAGINASGNLVQGGLNYKKTGRHFPQVAELIEIMKGKQRNCSTCKRDDGNGVPQCTGCYAIKGYNMWEPKEGAE